ncbi:MAG TPA: hypothetical protein VHA78_05855 [Candidatus Peribacteraceae bacterium]|nr:hypothetical protein [Candidatus Peribacteraceae bacterium]
MNSIDTGHSDDNFEPLQIPEPTVVDNYVQSYADFVKDVTARWGNLFDADPHALYDCYVQSKKQTGESAAVTDNH